MTGKKTKNSTTLAAVPDITCIGSRRGCPCRRCWLERKRYVYEYEHGHRRLVDAEPVRRHLDAMAAQGIGRRTIAEAVGINHSTLRRITMGEVATVKQYTARKILAFTPARANRITNAFLVDATATVKRVRALQALGYSTSWIGERCSDSKYIEIRTDKVTRQRALAVLKLCKRVGEKPGPNPQLAAQARKKGWRRPQEYDEDLFYDRKWDGSEPDVAVECRAIQLVGEYDHMKSFGMSEEMTAERLGITVNYLRALLSKRSRGVAPFGPAEAHDARMIG